MVKWISTTLTACMAGASVLLFIGDPAPYGRYSDQAKGPRVPARVAWIVQELPSALVPLLLLRWSITSRANQILFLAFVGHYVNRTFVYSLRIRGGKPTPLPVCVSAFVFTSINGYIQGTTLVSDNFDTSPLFYLGLVVFVTGALINIRSDAALRRLRGRDDPSYKIPRGGLFEYVSCANYLGEIIEWTGFAIAMRGHFAGTHFALNTVFNLVPRALSHHAWYRSHFKDDYPPRRKAVLPFLL